MGHRRTPDIKSLYEWCIEMCIRQIWRVCEVKQKAIYEIPYVVTGDIKHTGLEGHLRAI